MELQAFMAAQATFPRDGRVIVPLCGFVVKACLNRDYNYDEVSGTNKGNKGFQPG
jgi:predicted GNAT family acetyltransferase